MPIFMVRPIGVVRSILTRLENAPRQGDEGAPQAWLEISGHARDGLTGITVGMELIVLTWLHLARREALVVHPRGDPARPPAGVFVTRSPDRPNPIGLHPVTVLEVDGFRLRVAPLEAVDGTPIIDIKSVLGPPETR